MSKITATIEGALHAVVSQTIVTAAMIVSITDNLGAAQSVRVEAADFPANDGGGHFALSFVFPEGFAEAAFTGSMVSVDASGVNVADPISFSDSDLEPLAAAPTPSPAPNTQWVPDGLLTLTRG